jgi:hypothetical protein
MRELLRIVAGKGVAGGVPSFLPSNPDNRSWVRS